MFTSNDDVSQPLEVLYVKSSFFPLICLSAMVIALLLFIPY